MKKKTLIVLLVLLLVGVLAFTAFACKKKEPIDNGGNDGTKPGPQEPTDEPKIDAALEGIVASVNELAKVIVDIDNAASVSATIFLNAKTTGTDDDLNIGLEVKLSASMDGSASAKNWALIEVKDSALNKNVVSLYAVSESDGEYLYLGQPLTASTFKWSKLSQAKDAGLIDGKLVPEIVKAIAGISSDTEGDLEAGILNNIEIVNTIVGTLGLFGGSIFSPVGDNADFAVDGGYALSLNVGGLGSFIKDAEGLLKKLLTAIEPYMDLIDLGTNILLGGPLSGMIDGTWDPTDAVLPVIDLTVDVDNDMFSGLGISYTKDLEDSGKVNVAFGLKDVALAATSSAAPTPFTGTPEEFALKLSIDASVPAGANLAAQKAVIDVYVKPAVTLGFYGEDGNARDGYFKVDFEGLTGYATITIDGGAATPIAEYIATGENPGFYVDLAPLAGLVDGSVTLGKYYIPLDAQTMYDNWIDDVAERDIFSAAYVEGNGAALGGLEAYTIENWKAANKPEKDEKDEDYEKRAQEGWKAAAEDNARAYAEAQQKDGKYLVLADNTWTSAAAAPMNAAGNEIDTIIGSVGSIIADSSTANLMAQIGKIANAVINDGGLLDKLTALLEDTTLFELTEKDYEEYGVVVALDALMGKLLATDGLIGGMLQSGDDATTFGLYTGTANEKEKYTLADLLKGDDVLGHINTLVNSLIYESNLNKDMEAWKKVNAKNEGETDEAYNERAYNAVVVTDGKTYEAFLATDAAVTATEIAELFAMVGFTVPAEDGSLYDGIKLDARITMGDGFRAGIALSQGSNTISFGIGFDIIDAAGITVPTMDWTGAQTTAGRDPASNNLNENKLYNDLKELANAVLPPSFQIGYAAE